MNKDLDVITSLYRPYKITKHGKCTILNTMEGDYVVKADPSIDYKHLYHYLHSRNFTYYPKLVDCSRDTSNIFEYQEDLSVDTAQKATDLIHIVALLHAKTCYFKEITNDRYKEIFDDIKNNILYIQNYYTELYDSFLREVYYSPSQYLFLRNYSLLYHAISYVDAKVDEWFLKVKDKNKMRVCLVHNNLSLDHFIKNEEEYLISWDQYTFDTPVLDLYHFYQNEWARIPFLEIFSLYQSDNELLEEEKLLLDILISIPTKVEFGSNELENTKKIRELINYLSKSSKIVLSN